MQTKREIQELLVSAGVSPNRRLGQHFLVDLNLMRLLLDSAGLRPSDVVLEVGTGTGSLTEALVERVGRVVGVELDPVLAEIARSRLTGATSAEILNTDVLSGKGSLGPAVLEAVERARRGEPLSSPSPISPEGQARGPAPTEDGRLLLVSNLPYDVASPVMINLVKGPLRADVMCVTVQKEVADRMTAPPGTRDYGTLSILLAATGEVEQIRTLKPGVFWPPPQVDSAIVRYSRDEAKCRRIEDMGLFGEVAGLFLGHRRKMLRACIRYAPSEWADRETWLRIFAEHGIDPARRPADLTPAQFVAIANSVHEVAIS